MTYQETMEFLDEIKKYGSVLGLDSIRALMKALGDVHLDLPVIHVAGTNGKGSVSSFLSSIYRSAGYHVCRFATPDVFSYEEEFLYDDRSVEKEELAEVFTVVKEACEQLVLGGSVHPTRFEVETAAAFLWFSKKKPDICIVEVGLGGETDATNVIQNPVASVLTSISKDHEAFLGNTLTAIARVKAGIIKSGCPVIATWQEEEVCVVIEQMAADKNAPLAWASLPEGDFPYPLSLKGTFQVQNAALAWKVVQVLQAQYPVTENALAQGFAKTVWAGRFELLGTDPEFYIDGAHNPAAAKQLRATLDTELAEQKIVYIMGVLADKDYEEIGELMFQEGDLVYCITPDNPRALSARELTDVLLEQDVKAYEVESVEKAVACAVEYARLTDAVVVAFGSLSYLKEVKEAYEQQDKRRYQTIFWDMDGTIINSYPGIVESVLYALEQFGMTETDSAVMRRFIGPPLRVTFGEVYHMDEEQIELAVAKYREHYHAGAMYHCQVYPGVEQAMEQFRQAGYRQYVTSSKPEGMCKKILQWFDLDTKLDGIVGASLDGRIDTKQQVLEEAFRRLDDSDRSQVVLIGDTRFDAEGAKKAGIDCIGITYGFGTRAEMEALDAKVFDRIEDVVTYIGI